MIIQHNISALNSYNKLATNNSAVQKNLEKLSSGYRINRAGDDAAGLAISEKMRAQVTGLERAKLNAQDGISLVQTAEGALTEVHSMLNRLVELGTESANGIYQAEDREKIQAEVNQITEEVDRISKATNFNGIALLDGSLSTSTKNAASATGNAQVLKGSTLETKEAVKGKYAVELGNTGTIKGTANNTAGYAADITLTLSDGSEVTSRVVFDGTMSAASVNDAIAAKLNSDEKLNKLFSVSVTGNTASAALKLEFESKSAGTTQLGVTKVKIQGMKADASGDFTVGANNSVFSGTVADGNVNASATTKAGDKYSYLQFNDGNVPNKNSTITIGDNTFEFKGADDYDIKSGNVRVVMGKTERETLENLQAAMKLKGISSVSLTDDNKLRIDDLKQLNSTTGTSLKMDSVSPGISFGDSAALNGKFTSVATVNAIMSNAGGNNFTIKYTTNDGEEKSYTITDINKGGVAAADSAGSAKMIADAINKDATMKELFTASSSTDGSITIIAKDDKGGAKVTGFEASAGVMSTGVVTSGVTEVDKAHGSGQTLAINQANLNSKDTLTIGGKTFRFLDKKDAENPANLKEGEVLVLKGADGAETSKNLQAALTTAGIKFKDLGTKDGKEVLLFEHGTEQKQEVVGGLTLQIGDTADDFNKVTVSVDDMSSKGLGLDNLQVTDQGIAANSITKVKSAIEKVSVNRGRLGALQNRLEHTISNLATTTENMTSAESRIRDTDMAKEMMHFTKNNVLVQAAQSMLAQANQQPQQVLQLLR